MRACMRRPMGGEESGPHPCLLLLVPPAGSRFQQHLARETDPDAAPALAVFAINPVDAAWQVRGGGGWRWGGERRGQLMQGRTHPPPHPRQRAAICGGFLPRLGVAAMVAHCGRLGLPWAGYIPPALLLASAAEAGGGAGGLPEGLVAQLRAAEAGGGPTVLAVRRCV